MSIDLNDMALDVIAWRRKRWPIPDGTSEMLKDAAKVAEEAGEVVGAVIKHLEGRGATVDVEYEIADAMIALFALAGVLNMDVEKRLTRRWWQVSRR